MYIVQPKNQEALDKEHQELIDTEITLAFEPISADILGDIQMSPKDLLLLDWLIVE